MKGDLRRNKGFTLIELLIVVAILGIIAIIAIPIYVGARRDAARNEARSNLTVLYGLEHQFRNEFNTFRAGALLTADGTGGAGDLAMASAATGNIGFRPGVPAMLNYTYTVAAGPAGIATSFVATATPVRGPVSVPGEPALTITQDNVKNWQ